MSDATNYAEMSVQQRAAHLLKQGVTAKLGIDPETMTPGYSAYVGNARLFGGYHMSESAAIEAGTRALEAKAAVTEDQS
jgi:hypothetical protein